MEEIKDLILAVQIAALPVSLFRAGYIYFDHMQDENTKMRNKKMKNLAISLILIEISLSMAYLIMRYYGSVPQ